MAGNCCPRFIFTMVSKNRSKKAACRSASVHRVGAIPTAAIPSNSGNSENVSKSPKTKDVLLGKTENPDIKMDRYIPPKPYHGESWLMGFEEGRKQTAEEIFKELDKFILSDDETDLRDFYDFFQDLKKKYLGTEK